jgi:LDH2 family malate/lactate/ureidoglycolate dehydrogenase
MTTSEEPLVVSSSGPAIVLDAADMQGHLAAEAAVRIGIEKARELGVAAVAMRRCYHIGVAGRYARIAAENGCVAFAMCNTKPVMAAPGGAEKLVGTNPLTIALPVKDSAPIVLDMATTIVSYGTVKASVLNGRGIAPGWMIDKKTGEALLDADRLSDGLLLPIGGYKGSGLAMVLGFLAGTLNDAVFGRDVVDFNYDDTTVTNTGHFILAIDVARFIDRARFGAEIDRHIRDLKSSTPLPGQKIRMPGEKRGEMRREGGKQGIAFTPAVIGRLNQMARDIGAAELDVGAPAIGRQAITSKK